MFELFKKRHYKVCYKTEQGLPAVNRTTRRSIAFQIMRDREAAGCTDIVLWQRPRPY